MWPAHGGDMQEDRPTPGGEAGDGGLRRRRSAITTVLGWAIIVVSALMTPMSAISLLMILAQSHGTGSTTVLGFLGVVVAPPVTVAAGIGLLLRHRWARYYVMVLLVVLVGVNVRSLLTARPTPTTYTSPSGVTTIIMASGPNYHSLPIIAVSVAALGWLASRRVRDEFAGVRRVEGSGGVAVAGTWGARAADAVAVAPRPATPSAAKQRASLVLMVVLLLVGAAVMGWQATTGLNQGVTRIPGRFSSRHPVHRQQKPVLFFTILGLYAVASVGTAGLAGVMIYTACRPGTPRHA